MWESSDIVVEGPDQRRYSIIPLLPTDISGMPGNNRLGPTLQRIAVQVFDDQGTILFEVRGVAPRHLAVTVQLRGIAVAKDRIGRAEWSVGDVYDL
jgi:hypothetical protein